MFVLAVLTWYTLPLLAQGQSDDVVAKYRWDIPDHPYNCEMNLQHLEHVRNMLSSQTNRKDVLIILARLGNGEKRRDLNLRRLNNVRKALTQTLGIEAAKVVTGRGEHIKGYGRVEFYIGGELVGALLISKHNPVIKCVF